MKPPLSQISPRFLACAGTLLVMLPFVSYAADTSIQVALNTTKAGPRAIESLTEKAISRDYRLAWIGLAHALEFNDGGALEGPFSGDAKKWLQETIAQQQKTEVRRRFINQRHQLEAVLYAPEGDVMELHDTATYQEQILDGTKLVEEKQITVRYVVLMTPGADRWVIRQLQAVPRF